MKFLIVDGLRTTRLFYKELVESIYENAEIFQCMSAEDAIFNVIDLDPDIIISSEILPFRNGFEMARILNKMNNKTPIILIAEDDTNAIQAIKQNVFDYIVMPISSNKIKVSIANAVGHINKFIHLKMSDRFSENIKLRINTIHGFKLINLEEIAYCIAEGVYTQVFFLNGDCEVSNHNLGKIEDSLLGSKFVRISRSVIINLDVIFQIDKTNGVCILELQNGMQEIKISKDNIRKLELNGMI